jgi:hypothetical protein
MHTRHDDVLSLRMESVDEYLGDVCVGSAEYHVSGRLDRTRLF